MRRMLPLPESVTYAQHSLTASSTANGRLKIALSAGPSLIRPRVEPAIRSHELVIGSIEYTPADCKHVTISNPEGVHAMPHGKMCCDGRIVLNSPDQRRTRKGKSELNSTRRALTLHRTCLCTVLRHDLPQVRQEPGGVEHTTGLQHTPHNP
jgi:hypothetical protein